MKKILLAFIALAGFAVQGHSQVITTAQGVWEVVRFKTTISSTTVGITASELTGNTTSQATTGGISQIKVTNATTGSTVCCGSESTVTCNTGAATDGEPIAPVASGQRNFLAWAISITQRLFCISTAASTGITVAKVR